jgi:acyl-CoA thioester hydrolase
MNYLEHARHEYLNDSGVNFNQMHIDGYDAVVVRAEIDYKKSLKSGDAFIVKTGARREGRLKIVFHQQIIRNSDQALMLDAVIFTACMYKNKPREPVFLLEKLGLI